MPNEWYYRLFHVNEPPARLASHVARVLELLAGAGAGPALTTFNADNWEGEEAAITSAGLTESLVAANGCAMLYFPEVKNNAYVSVDSEAGTITLSLYGNPGQAWDSRRDRIVRDVFLTMCRGTDVVFGLSEAAYAVEDLWHNAFGIGGWEGLLNVGHEEVMDVHEGRLPRILPWLAYMRTDHITDTCRLRASLPAELLHDHGPKGLLMQLSDGPWDNLFAVREVDGAAYHVVNAFGEACNAFSTPA